MSLGLIGKKIGMTRVFDEESGQTIPVNVIDVADNQFVQVKTKATDGYSAVQVAYGEQKKQRLSKPVAGHLEKFGASPKKHIKEFRFETDEELPDVKEHPGAELFSEGQVVDVIGTTKGKGFQGVVRRYNFSGQPDSHGHMMHRRTGAIGAGSWPARVWKGKKMPGRHGCYRRTTQNLKVIQVRAEDNVILVSGAIPGHNGQLVVVRPAIKKQKNK